MNIHICRKLSQGSIILGNGEVYEEKAFKLPDYSEGNLAAAAPVAKLLSSQTAGSPKCSNAPQQATDYSLSGQDINSSTAFIIHFLPQWGPQSVPTVLFSSGEPCEAA